MLIAEMGTLIHDAAPAPVDFGKQMPGIEFHANMIESLIQNTPLIMMKPAHTFVWVLILATIVFYWCLFARFFAINLIVFGGIFGLFIVSQYLYTSS